MRLASGGRRWRALRAYAAAAPRAPQHGNAAAPNSASFAPLRAHCRERHAHRAQLPPLRSAARASRTVRACVVACALQRHTATLPPPPPPLQRTPASAGEASVTPSWHAATPRFFDALTHAREAQRSTRSATASHHATGGAGRGRRRAAPRARGRVRPSASGSGAAAPGTARPKLECISAKHWSTPAPRRALRTRACCRPLHHGPHAPISAPPALRSKQQRPVFSSQSWAATSGSAARAPRRRAGRAA
jgi:hypothetical protein